MLQNLINLIPVKLKRLDTWSYALKRIIYIVSFVGLCLIDQIIGSATGYIQYGLKNYTGIILAVIMLTAYKLKDFFKIPYLIWCIIFFIGRHFILDWGSTHSGNYLELQTNLWGAGVYGVLLIRMFYLYVIERKKPRMHWLPFGVTFVMLLGMAVIRSDYDWPKALGVAFLLFHLTDFKEKDLNNLYSGMMDGMIIGFLIIQGQAWLHRPYDTRRYLGMYSHSNWNALFYVCTYCAVLCKWYLMKLKRRHIVLRLPFILLAGLIVGTDMYTGSRTGFITLIAVTLVFLVFQMWSRKRWKLVELLVDGIVLAAAIGVCILPSYWLIRYVPVYGNDPIYFEADNRDKKIQQGDPADDEKYVEFEEAKTEMYNRYLWFLEKEQIQEVSDTVSEWLDMLFPPLKADASTEVVQSEASAEEVYVEPGTDREHPLVRTFDEDMAGYDIRLDIYKYFWKKLPLIGEKGNIQGVWLSYNFAAAHCHNVLLQIAYDFGIIIGVLFIAVILMLYGKVLVGLVKKKSGSWYYRLFVTAIFTTAFVVFGMFEMVCVYGQLPFTMFFIVQYIVYHKRADEVPVKQCAPAGPVERGEDVEQCAEVLPDKGAGGSEGAEVLEDAGMERLTFAVEQSAEALPDRETGVKLSVPEETAADEEPEDDRIVEFLYD